MSQTVENNTNTAIVVPVNEDVPMVVDNFDDKIAQIECEVEEVQELAQVRVEKLKADKAERERKRLEDEQRREEELRKAEELQKAEDDRLEEEEAAAKMHGDKAKEQQDVSSAFLCFSSCKLTSAGGGGSADL